MLGSSSRPPQPSVVSQQPPSSPSSLRRLPAASVVSQQPPSSPSSLRRLPAASVVSQQPPSSPSRLDLGEHQPGNLRRPMIELAASSQRNPVGSLAEKTVHIALNAADSTTDNTTTNTTTNGTIEQPHPPKSLGHASHRWPCTRVRTTITGRMLGTACPWR